jgi:hypothetical protein
MNIDIYWHILWTAYPVPMPSQQRNTINGLYELYERLTMDNIEHEVSQPLRAIINSSKVKPDRPILNLQSLENDFISLTSEEGDRIAGNLNIIDLLVKSDRVELLVKFNGDNLIQKIARLKSRSATLLSFSSKAGEGGKQTWSKGIWYGKSINSNFVLYVKDRISQLKNS